MIYLTSVFIALIAASMEAVSYIGFIHNHLGIRAYYLYLISVVLSYFSTNYSSKILTLFKVASYGATIIYGILIFAEGITYPNFVFTATHINPFTFQLFVGLIWFHYLIISRVNFIKSVLLAGILFVGIDGAGRTLAIMVKNLNQIIQHPFASYSQKMTDTYPGFYPAMQAVKKITPDDAIIYIPPQGNPWEIEGNVAMVTYFLYPRKVINLDPTNIENLPPKSFLLIAKGSWLRTGAMDYGWPKIPVKSSQIWKIDTHSNTVNNFQKDYNPLEDKWDWGLIEVNND